MKRYMLVARDGEDGEHIAELVEDSAGDWALYSELWRCNCPCECPTCFRREHERAERAEEEVRKLRDRLQLND